MKFPYLAPESGVVEFDLGSRCMIPNSMLGDDTNSDMDFDDIANPFGIMEDLFSL